MSRAEHSNKSRLSFAGNRAGHAFAAACVLVSIALAFAGWWPLVPLVGALVGAFGIRGAYLRLALAFPAGWLLVLIGEAATGRHILAASTAISQLAGLGSGPYAPIVVTLLVAWLLPSAGYYFGRSMRGLARAWMEAGARRVTAPQAPEAMAGEESAEPAP
ncbi:MAG: hypothetical protein M0000_08115 [Actinomycetota bacterium]|nr:hypothetical protein [Actinomycetota bacterium]MDA8207636.1 hypothetical protein [Actinomycetota bacterium]